MKDNSENSNHFIVSGSVKMDSTVWDEKKNTFVDLNSGSTFRPRWVSDASVSACKICREGFSFFKRKVEQHKRKYPIIIKILKI